MPNISIEERVTEYQKAGGDSLFNAIYHQIGATLRYLFTFHKLKYFALCEFEIRAAIDDSLLEALDAYNPGKGKFISFLKNVTGKRMIDRFRYDDYRRRREVSMEIIPVDSSLHLTPQTNGDFPYEQAEKAIDSLSDKSLDALYLGLKFGLYHEEIADILGKSRVTVTKSLGKIRWGSFIDSHIDKASREEKRIIINSLVEYIEVVLPQRIESRIGRDISGIEARVAQMISD